MADFRLKSLVTLEGRLPKGPRDQGPSEPVPVCPSTASEPFAEFPGELSAG